jgi:hypothetical protein
MPSSLYNFTYPITCCDVGNVFQTNWNNLPSSQLQGFANCAAYGTNIYTTVSFYQLIIRNKDCFCFQGLL